MGISLGGLRDNFYISKEYEGNLSLDIKKQNGVYYTPKQIVDYMLEKTIKNHDILKNPYPKILDISCGCGNFLLEAYDILYDLFEENIHDLRDVYNNSYWKTDNIHNHIISNCIYGYDIDNNAINILINNLLNKGKDIEIDKINIKCTDSLMKEFDVKFDYILSNPPYIGQKLLDKNYKKILSDKYNEVYKDKADLYFCFYEKIIKSLKDNGRTSIISPRYFLESPSGLYLRNYIKENTKIEEIVDFLGYQVFKNVGVSNCIITLKKEKADDNVINIYKIKNEDKDLENKLDLSTYIKSNEFEKININQKSLGNDWIIASSEEIDLYNKIESKGNCYLENIAVSFQGIITGCDKAFIINKNDKNINKIDDKLLKSWIKNKNISNYIVNKSNYKLIYSNDIIDENKYNYILNNYIGLYKEKLLNRRECIKNMRKWHELQWGRDKELFERIKIMYPYKCDKNKFAIDYDNNFCSADVYSFYIKDEYKDEFSYEYLVGILNSEIYDRYYKINAKKMSKNIYDYYPNKVMKIKIFKDENYKEIEKLSKKIMNILREDNNGNIDYLQDKINKLIKKSLNI